MKSLLQFISTTVILIGVNSLIYFLTDYKFLDFSLIIGIIATIFSIPNNMMSKLFSSSLQLEVQGSTGMKVENKSTKRSFRLPVFLASFSFTIVVGIFTFIEYKDYFI